MLLVRAGEIKSVSYFFGLFLLLGIGVALGQGSAEALFFKRYGIQYLPAMYVVLSIVLCTASVLYAAYVDRFPAERVFEMVFPILIAAIAIAWLLMTFTAYAVAYPVYYLVYQVATELLVVHSALYVSQNFEILQAKRLSALIMAGSQVGIIAGGLSLSVLVRFLGVQNVLLAWALLMAVALVGMRRWHTKHGASRLFRRHREARYGGLGHSVRHISQGMRFVRESPLQRADSLGLLFMVIAYYILSYSLNLIYTHSFASDRSLASFFGALTAVNSGIALLLQLVLTNRVISRFGVRKANLVFPLSCLLSFGILLIKFEFIPALLGSFSKDVLMPAFREPARHVMREALPGNVKGRAGATSLVVVLPVALLICGSLLWLTQAFHSPAYYLIAGAVAAVLYLRYSLRMNKTYAREMIRHLRNTLSIPGGLLDSRLRGGGPAMLQELRNGVLHRDPQVSNAFAKAFLSANPDLAAETILERATRADPVLHDQLLKLLVPYNPKGLESHLLKRIETEDPHLRATVLRTLFQMRSESASVLVAESLESGNPRLVCAGIQGVLRYPIERCRARAFMRWRELLESLDLRDNLPALEAVADVSTVDASDMESLEVSVRGCILRNLGAGGRGRSAALKAIERWPLRWSTALDQPLAEAFESADWAVRQRCVFALGKVESAIKDTILARALEDPDPRVRKAAVAEFNDGTEDTQRELLGWLVSENRGSPRSQKTVLANLQEAGLQPEALVDIALAKTAQARELADALTALNAAASISPPLQLLARVVEERLQQVLDLALMAIQPLEDPGTIGAIRLALKSREPRHVSSGCESFRNFWDKRLAGALADLMEYFVTEERQSIAPSPKGPSVRAVIERAMSSQDPWLSRCAGYANGRLAEVGIGHAGSV